MHQFIPDRFCSEPSSLCSFVLAWREMPFDNALQLVLKCYIKNIEPMWAAATALSRLITSRYCSSASIFPTSWFIEQKSPNFRKLFFKLKSKIIYIYINIYEVQTFIFVGTNITHIQLELPNTWDLKLYSCVQSPLVGVRHASFAYASAWLLQCFFL